MAGGTRIDERISGNFGRLSGWLIVKRERGIAVKSKKIVVGIAALLLPFAGVWAAGSGDKGKAPAQSGPVKIVFATGKDLTGTNPKLVELFNSTHKDIQVEYLEMPPSTTDQHDKYATVFAAKDSSIDIVAADSPWVPEFASAGWFLELDTMSGYEDITKDYFEGPLLATTFKNRTYAIPWYNNAGVLFYRTDLLEKAGLKPPKTFEELIDISRKLQKSPDLHGFVWQGFQYEGLVCNWMEYLWGMGGDYYDAKAGKVILDTPEAVASVQLMTDLVQNYKISPESVFTFKETESYNVFLSGNAVFVRGWPSFIVNANKEGSKVKGVTGIIPMPHAPGQKPGATLGTWNVAISKFTKHPKEAWEVVKFLSSVEGQKQKALMGGNPPARKSIYADKDVAAKYPHFATLYDVMNSAKPRPVTPAYPQISAEVIQVNLTAAMTHKISAAEAVKKIKAETEKILTQFK